jgi:hypothetical protein
MATLFSDEFYALLARVQTSYGPIIDTVPKLADCIEVDLNSRRIKIEDSSYAEWLSVETDHRAEVIYFEVDRYYEDVDLRDCTIIIEYINAHNDARIYPVSFIDTDSRPGKMIIAWNIGNAATAYAGTIQFALVFYKVDTNKHIVYKLSTIPAEGKIEHGMGYKIFDDPNYDIWKEQDNYYAMGENYPTLLAELTARIEEKMTWRDV